MSVYIISGWQIFQCTSGVSGTKKAERWLSPHITVVLVEDTHPE